MTDDPIVDYATFAMVELRILRLMEDADRAGSEIGSRDTRIALKILRMAFPELQPPPLCKPEK